jgi:DNA processing protein
VSPEGLGTATAPSGADAADGVAPIVRPGQWPDGFAAGGPNRDALLALAHLEGLTPRDLNELAWREGTALGCLGAVRRGAGSDLDRHRASSVDPATVHEALAGCGARLVAPGDGDYPHGLLDLPDPPGWLFVRGDLAGARGPAVAIVGARSCSPYGMEVAELMGSGLTSAGVAVVSGAARGIDGAAHRGALAVGGPTIAVLGSGIDIPYPKVHRHLLDRITACGAVVSEYPPGLRPHPRRFPARNRIVAALARLVVVVEGAAGSGSLITAEFAQDLHRDLLAVPGPVTSELSAVPHELIRDGAGLVRDAGDVLELLGLVPRRATARRPASGTEAASTGSSSREESDDEVPPPADLPEPERAVLQSLGGTGQVVEQVARRSGLATPAALRALVALELRGLVVASGGRYRRPAG